MVSMFTGRSDGRGRNGRAFTLVELLVTISIIAVLVAILLPALGKVRAYGRSTKCLSNLRQISLGWMMYLNNHDGVFPYEPDGPNDDLHHMFDWGGVDWLSDEYHSDYEAAGRMSPHRPINPYIGSELEEESRAEIFLCPSDTHVKLWGAEDNPYLGEDDIPFAGEAEDTTANGAARTTYGTIGTSYRANAWIWTKVGGVEGWSQTHPENHALENRQGFAVQPSKFVLIGDLGPFLAGRYPLTLREGSGVLYGWWHGEEQSNMGFLDGSARRVTMEPGGFTDDYHFWLEPWAHHPESVLYPGLLSSWWEWGETDDGDGG